VFLDGAKQAAIFLRTELEMRAVRRLRARFAEEEGGRTSSLGNVVFLGNLRDFEVIEVNAIVRIVKGRPIDKVTERAK
jgi:hypothetical protein